MKRFGLVVAAVLLAGCSPVVITPSASALANPSPSPTPSSSALTIDCGPISDAASCDAAVEAALRFSKVPRVRVASVIFVDPAGATCPGRAATCRYPTTVRLLGLGGTYLDTVLLAETGPGVWEPYPVAQADTGPSSDVQ